jgi:hypothetical protein
LRWQRAQGPLFRRLGTTGRPGPRGSVRFDSDEMDEQPGQVGHWGPVTATLDWCEVRVELYVSEVPLSNSSNIHQANYQFSRYVAEMSNTFSNLFFVYISLYGAWLSLRQSLPARYLVGFAVRLPRRLLCCSVLIL